MKKKFSKRNFKKNLDSLWSRIVRSRDKKCVVCGSRENLQAHHCIVRKAQGNKTRWEPDNGITLCYVCHMFKLHGNQGDKEFLDKYLKEINARVPKERQEEIIVASHEVLRDNKFNLEVVQQKLHGELLKLIGGE